MTKFKFTVIKYETDNKINIGATRTPFFVQEKKNIVRDGHWSEEAIANLMARHGRDIFTFKYV